jgi:hypothetical protein
LFIAPPRAIPYTESGCRGSPRLNLRDVRRGHAPRIPDVHDAAKPITANGGKILNGPMEVPGGDWIVNAMDPQGAAFGLHARKAQ